MDRRKFLKGTALFSGLLAVNPFGLVDAKNLEIKPRHGKKAKNIIFMVSDGMSSGTLALANLYSNRILGRNGNWNNLYLENRVSRALMDTASESSIVTES